MYVNISSVLYMMCMLLSVTVQEVEPTVQNVDTKGNSVNLTALSY